RVMVAPLARLCCAVSVTPRSTRLLRTSTRTPDASNTSIREGHRPNPPCPSPHTLETKHHEPQHQPLPIHRAQDHQHDTRRTRLARPPHRTIHRLTQTHRRTRSRV